MKNAGIPYFPLEAVNNDAVEGLLDRYGNKGLGIYIRLLQRIYGINGYYMPYDNSIKLTLGRKLNEGYNLVDDIVHYLVQSEIFNKQLLQKFCILTSNEIQKNYLNAVKRRKTIELVKDYLLDFAIAYVSSSTENVSINKNNVYIIGQRKENESKQNSDITNLEDNKSCTTIKASPHSNSINKFKEAFPDKFVGINTLPAYVNIDLLIEKLKISPWIQDKPNFTLDYMCKEKVYNKIIAGVYTQDRQKIECKSQAGEKEDLSYLFDSIEDIY